MHHRSRPCPESPHVLGEQGSVGSGKAGLCRSFPLSCGCGVPAARSLSGARVLGGPFRVMWHYLFSAVPSSRPRRRAA